MYHEASKFFSQRQALTDDPLGYNISPVAHDDAELENAQLGSLDVRWTISYCHAPFDPSDVTIANDLSDYLRYEIPYYATLQI